MTDIDARLRQLVHEMVDTAPIADETTMPIPDPTREADPVPRRGLLVAAAVAVVLGGAVLWVALAGGDKATTTVDSPVDVASNSPTTTVPDLGEANSFRNDLLNQTGTAYLSLSDYIAIRTAACAGAVNNPDELLNLADTWRLGALSGNKNAGNAIWLAARQVCPDMFDADNLESGPPFPLGGGFSATQGERVDGVPDVFPNFIDLSVLNDPQLWWVPGKRFLVGSTTALSGEEAVAHFRNGFPDGWTVNEVLGPIVDASGFREWSIDIDGFGWDGVVTVLTGDFGTPGENTTVSIALAHA